MKYLHFYSSLILSVLSTPLGGLARRRPVRAGMEHSLETPDAQVGSGGHRRTPGVRFHGVEQPTEEQGRRGAESHLA